MTQTPERCLAMHNFTTKSEVRVHSYAHDLNVEVTATSKPSGTMHYEWVVRDAQGVITHGPFPFDAEANVLPARHATMMKSVYNVIDAYVGSILRARVEAPDGGWLPTNNASSWRKTFQASMELTAIVQAPRRADDPAQLVVISPEEEEILSTSLASTSSAMRFANRVVPVVAEELSIARTRIATKVLDMGLPPAALLFGSGIQTWAKHDPTR